MKIRSLQIKWAEENTDSDYFTGKIRVWVRGNYSRWVEPRWKPRIGHSGSVADPYHTLHIYIYKLDICFWKNPLKPIYNLIQEWLQDRFNSKNEILCPYCGSPKLREGNGFAYEPLIYCKACGKIVWSADPEPYCR